MGVGGAANRYLLNVNILCLTSDILLLSRVTDACLEYDTYQMFKRPGPDKSVDDGRIYKLPILFSYSTLQ